MLGYLPVSAGALDDIDDPIHLLETLTLTEIAVQDQIVADTLTITESVSAVKGVGDTLALYETVEVGYGFSDTLSLTELAEQINNPYPNDTLVFTEAATFVYIKTVTETLNLTELAAQVHTTVSVSDTLAFTETVVKIAQQDVVDTLALTDTATTSASRYADDTLSLTEVATTGGSVYSASLTDTLTLTEQTTRTVIKECYDAYDPTIGIRSQTTISYPYTTPTYTVNLRNPEFGNRHTSKSRQYLHTLRGGEYAIGTPVNTLDIEVLDFVIQSLSETQRNDLLALLIASAGDEIKLVDHENRTWRGVIVNNPIELLEGMDGCNYSVQLQFEGSLV